LSLKQANLAVLANVLLIILNGSVLAEERPSVRSLMEVRKQNIVIQNWDLSCGAAALATILNYQHGESVSEREVATRMMSREEYLANPMLVRLRQGFSLLDMKRFVDDRGYNGIGLGQMTLAHLIERAPVIVPINAYGYQHFVVFRGVLDNRVLLADPAFGNRTMQLADFESAWIDFTEIGRVGFVVVRKDGLIPPNLLAPDPGEFVTLN